MSLAQRIRDQRYLKGWGPEELASRASISRTALYQIESGRTEQPRAATLRRIAQALDLPTETLLGPHLGVVVVDPSSKEPPTTFRPSEPQASPFWFRLDDQNGTLRNGDLDRKFREVLASPLGEGVARIVEETHRILPRYSVEARW